jgi:uncharacterized protein YcsI (UPF0317 family)
VRQAKQPLSQREIVARSTGASDKYLRAELAVVIDQGWVVEVAQKAALNHQDPVPLYAASPNLPS